MTVHYLKTYSSYFNALDNNLKRFEIRSITDRDYKVDDHLHLVEWKPTTPQYSVTLVYKVQYITAFEQRRNFVVIGLSDLIERYSMTYDRMQTLGFLRMENFKC